jgi:hypothetical protein
VTHHSTAETDDKPRHDRNSKPEGFESRTATKSSAISATLLLNCRRLPARLTTEQVAVLLGFRAHDIAILCRANLLHPLGKPAPNAPKYFEARFVEECYADTAWLARATLATSAHWKGKNARTERPSTSQTIESSTRRSRYAA